MKILNLFFIISLTTFPIASAAAGYAGQESRDIKSMSENDVKDLVAGKGMGYAKAAELNGFPGPAHVLELADKLQLSYVQKLNTQAIFDLMQASAKTVGTELVSAEHKLDTQFQKRTIDSDSLTRQLNYIASLQAKLRNIHLQAHLDQLKILSVVQVAEYNKLRGYDSTIINHHNHHANDG